jgi:hypothetical protein
MSVTKFHLFKLTLEFREDTAYQNFEEILVEDPRVLHILAKNGNPFRLDGKVKKANHLYSGTFCLIQKNELPIKAYLDKDPEKLLDDADEGGLGHYTSFLYDSTNNIIAIQFNKNGISANGIISYFIRNYKIKDIILEPIINPDKIEKLLEMSSISSFEISVARPEHFTGFNNSNKDFGEMNKIADITKASTIKLTVSVGYQKKSSLDKNSIISYVNNLLGRNQALEVKKIEIKGKETDDDNIQTLDLITNKVYIEVNYTSPRSINSSFMNKIIEKVIEEYIILKPDIDKFYKVKTLN